MSANSRGLLSAAFLLLLGTCSSAVWSGRPLTVDDANVNEPGHGQLEAWVARAAGSTVYNVAPAYAPVDGLEIGALLAREPRTSTYLSALQAKWRITPSQEYGCNVATVVGLAHATGAGNTNYLNGLVTCNQPALGSVHANLGVAKAAGTPKALSWGLAYEREVMGLTPHVEWFVAEQVKPTIQVGLRGNLLGNFQLDGSVGRSSGAMLYTLGAKLTF